MYKINMKNGVGFPVETKFLKKPFFFLIRGVAIVAVN